MRCTHFIKMDHYEFYSLLSSQNFYHSISPNSQNFNRVHILDARKDQTTLRKIIIKLYNNHSMTTSTY
jgi:hypothetical protein